MSSLSHFTRARAPNSSPARDPRRTPSTAAAATSALMIGVTALASVPIQFAHGFIQPPLGAAAVLGVLVGSRAGLRYAGRAKARSVKLLMAVVLLTVSTVYFFKIA